MFNLNELKNKKIGVLGLGIENQSLVNFLIKKKIGSQITVYDLRSKKDLGERCEKLAKNKNITWSLGDKFKTELDKEDILMRSPGWSLDCPGIKRALKIKQADPKMFLYSPMKLFFDFCPTENIIGVTGTKGKGTTSSLVYEIINKFYHSI